MNHSLSPFTQDVIHAYEHLQIGNAVCKAPYINNRRRGTRGGLAVHVGKGTPEEIIEEAELIAKKSHTDLLQMESQQLTQFLVDHHLGIDCSGFAYHVLSAEVHEQTGKSLAKRIKFPYIKNPLRTLLAKMNPVTRTGTKSLAHEKNSREVALSEIRPGDMIIMLGYGTKQDRDHIAVVESIESKMNTIIVHYVHSLAWQTDGKYQHGVRHGTMTISDPSKPLTEAFWEEQGITGEKNETFTHAKDASYLGVRRLHTLSTQ